MSDNFFGFSLDRKIQNPCPHPTGNDKNMSFWLKCEILEVAGKEVVSGATEGQGPGSGVSHFSVRHEKSSPPSCSLLSVA